MRFLVLNRRDIQIYKVHYAYSHRMLYFILRIRWYAQSQSVLRLMSFCIFCVGSQLHTKHFQYMYVHFLSVKSQHALNSIRRVWRMYSRKIGIIIFICLLKSIKRHSWKNGVRVIYWTSKQPGTNLRLLWLDNKIISAYSDYRRIEIPILTSQRIHFYIWNQFMLWIVGPGEYQR